MKFLLVFLLIITCVSFIFMVLVEGFESPIAKTFTKVSNDYVISMTKNANSYKIDDIGGVGRTFDGIGGLSGGGATSRLLVNYQEPYRSQILDFLFKPQFGASLHILKVEIGGDAQSTEGTEHSHMHTEKDENYTRGYEWWLMKEAKARNPNIKLIGLPWGWPGWIGQGTATPYKNLTLTANYVAKWVQGAKRYHNLTIDYVGIWNEKTCNLDYVKELRNILDLYGFGHVVIIACDSSFSAISDPVLSDTELANAVGVLGAHYPGTYSSDAAVKTGKQLWASEDYSTFNDVTGGGCWARILNQNHVNGNMSGTISWNLVASYYDALPFKRCSLMTANEPWSGHYELTTPLWVTAHTTQFTQPGWSYLHSVGHLQGGGSYVSLTDRMGSLTIIIETMSHNNSICIRPPLPDYTVKEQTASFLLGGSFKGKITKLNMWQTQLGSSSANDEVFVNKGAIQANAQGLFTIHLPVDVVITLSTIANAVKGSYPTSPSSKPFPLPYSENFNPNEFSEAYNFADQAGAFESFHNQSSADGHEWTLRQVVNQYPVTWCDDPAMAVSYIGDYNWSNVNATVSVMIENTDGVFIALRVDQGGCSTRSAKGLYLWLHGDGSWSLTASLERVNILKRCQSTWQCWDNAVFTTNGWNTLSLGITKQNKIYGYLNGKLIVDRDVKPDELPMNGFVAIGTQSFGMAQFDDFSVTDLS